MDKKLTDSEIVKALECCAINRSCKGCYLNTHEVNDMCPRVLMQNTLDLINRLEARIGVYETCNARKDEAIKHLESEVERLQAEKQILEIELKAMRGAANSYKVENERLEELIDVRHKVFETKCEELEIAKAEAYKECIEKVKDIDQCTFYGWIEFPEDRLDNLLKEMVGEDNERTT